MRWILGFVVFCLALAANAPFFGAVLLGALAWFMVKLFTPPSGDERAHEPGQPGVPQAPAAPPPATEEDRLDVQNAGALRAYLRRLADRVHTLEAEVAALRKGGPAPQPKAEPKIEQKVEPQPKAEPPPAPKPAAPIYQPPPPPPPPQPRPQPEVQKVVAPPPPPPPPPVPEAPKEPSFFYRLVSENIVAKVGAIILFFGVGFLLKYAYDHSMIPPQLRLLGVAATAAGVFIVGWKLRLGERRLYGLILQGVASGLAYLDVFFALKTYQFISVPVGFGLFALLGVATTLLAVRQDAKPLAVLGLTGAFLAPILASTGGGNVVFLFSYYLLLNLFILAVSWFKAWRVLNLTGWLFSLAVGALWGARSYTPALFWSIEPFLLAFFAIYLVIPIPFATRQPPELKGLVDGTLVFGTPAAVAAMQARLVWDMPYGLAWSSGVGAALYALLAVMAFRHRNMRLLAQTYVALAVGLGTLAVFYAFGAYTTFALWSIEGAAILWVCLRQKQLMGRLFALAVQVAGALYFALDFFAYSRTNPWFNDAVLGCAIIAVASALSAEMLRRYREEITAFERFLGSLVLAWGALWWAVGGIDAVTHGVTDARYWAAWIVLFFTATFLACEIVGTRLSWTALRGLTVAQPLVLFGCAFLQFERGTQPLAELGWLAWPAGFIAAFWILHRQRSAKFGLEMAARYGVTWLALGVVATWQALHYFTHQEWLYTMTLALVAYVAAGIRFHLRERDGKGHSVSGIPLVWALAFWYAGGLGWIHAEATLRHEPAAMIAFMTASALVAEFIGRAIAWPSLRGASGLLPFMLAGVALIQFTRGTHPLEGYGSLAWLAGFGGLLYSQHRQRADGFDSALGMRTFVTWALLVAIATWEALWWISRREYLYTLAIALAGYLFAAVRFRAAELGTERVRLSTAALVWSMFFWFVAGWLWLEQRLPFDDAYRAMLLFVAASALVYELAYRPLEWPALRVAALLPWVAIPGALLVEVVEAHRYGPLRDGWALVWPAALLAAGHGLWREEREQRFVAATARHAVLLYVPLTLVTWQLHWILDERLFGSAWLTAILAAPSALTLLGLTAARSLEVWPLQPQWPLYRDRLLLPIVIALALWALAVNVHVPGSLAPLTAYVPLLNPLDFTLALAALAVIVWAHSLESKHLAFLWQAVAILGFLWANAIALRTVHYWGNVPYRFTDLANSVVVQATLSILWTSTALALMLVSRRRMERKLWIAGATLLAVVVAKLFLVDLANTGTVERIVSFLGVGVILLVIGYVAPVPPGLKEAGTSDDAADTVARS
ncbi:MAG TPA: DUF2339 domain-containing protein [Burkholderiales bacterium]|nr:DUF2339 domain-containing protein [Burkholderiales bacterium]